MKLATALIGLCIGSTALAQQATTTSADAAPMDAATRQEIHRQRLATEFQLLNDARTTTFGSDFGVEGRLFTLRFALINEVNETPLKNAINKNSGGWAERLNKQISKAGPGDDVQSTVDDVTAALPPFRLTIGGEGKTFNLELGAVETTLGHGALVNRYLNNPRGRFNLQAMGLVVGAQARSVGGQIVTGSLLDPARFIGFNVKGRPLEWIWGTYSNFAPEQAGNLDAYALLLSMLTVGVSGAIDTTAPSTIINHVTSGNDLSTPPPVPGTAGGLSLEVDVGLNHDVLQAHVYGNGTMLGRTFNEVGIGTDGSLSAKEVTNLWGAGAAVGGRFNLFLEVLKIGGAAEYRLAGPNYQPAYFDRYYEADRIYGVTGGGPKITQRTVARHGYNLELGAQLLKTVGVFMEMNDMVPLDFRLGRNNATMRVGGMLHVLGLMSFMGAYVNRGFQDYLNVFGGSTGSMWLGEARLNLAILHLVARKWRAYDRAPSTNALYARDGYSVLAEIVIGIL